MPRRSTFTKKKKITINIFYYNTSHIVNYFVWLIVKTIIIEYIEIENKN